MTTSQRCLRRFMGKWTMQVLDRRAWRLWEMVYIPQKGRVEIGECFLQMDGYFFQICYGNLRENICYMVSSFWHSYEGLPKTGVFVVEKVEKMLLADIPNQIWNLGPSTCFFVNLRVSTHFVSTQQSVPTENTNIPIGSMHGIHLPTFIVGFLWYISR